MEEEIKKSLIQDLWDRKVPQYLGTYFAIGFGLFQFIDILSRRYELGEYLVDKFLLVWLVVLPAIIVLIYFGGKLNPETDSGTIKWPKILVFTNLFIAFLLAIFVFNAETPEIEQSQIVQLTNEEGKEIQAVIPKLNRVKTVACFQFENLTGDEKQDWWGVAFSNLLELNLDQHPEFYSFSQYSLERYYDRLGLAPFTLPNVGMQREIAQKSRSDYFTRISYKVEDKQYIFKGNLHSTSDASVISNINIKSENPYEGIDKIKQLIYNNIPDPITDVENKTSLPVASLITSNTEALQHYTQLNIHFSKNPNDIKTALDHGKKAITLDSSCSLCYLNVGWLLYSMGEKEEALPYVKNAVKYGASLPERMQFSAKENLYAITNRSDAYLKLLEVRRKMFPYEFSPYEQLIPIYRINYGIDSTKSLVRNAIDNGNVEKGLLALYDLLVANEEYIEAEKTLDQFSIEFPDRDQDRMKYANIYEKQGKIEEAKKILLTEETIDPLNTLIQTRLAYLDFKNLDISGAYKRLNNGIRQSTTLSDSLNFLWIKGHFLRMSGEIRKSVKTINDYESFSLKLSPVNQIMQKTFQVKTDLYQSIGNLDKVDDLMIDLNRYAPEEASKAYHCLVIANSIIRDYSEKLEVNQFLSCRDMYKTYGEGFVEYFEVLDSYRLKDYKNCIKILNEHDGKIKKILTRQNYFVFMIYLKAGYKDLAKEIVEKAIEQKTDEPIYYYQMAYLLEDENKKEAKKYLNVALKYWANADPDYIPLLKANDLAKRLSILDTNKS